MFYPDTLLILGNGFDCHCRLQSKYEHFFCSEIIDETNKSFGLTSMKQGVDGFWERLLFEHYKVNGKKNYNWCDIEKIIKDTLFGVFINKTYGGMELWKTVYNSVHSNRKLNEIFNVVECSPINKFLFMYCMNFYECSTVKSAKTPAEELSTHLLQQLNNLEKRFCKYLKNQITNSNNSEERNNNYIVNATNLLVKLTGFSTSTYSDISNILRQKYDERKGKDGVIHCGLFDTLADEFSKLKTISILSFNYTALFDILSVESPCIYNNVHGKLCNEQCTESCNSANVIFGIDDKAIQEESKAFNLRMFSKTYRKMLSVCKPSNILPQKNNPHIEIKFYGHSLGEADYSYFQSIFDYYDLYGNTNVHLTFYYSNGYEQNDAIYKLISSYGKTLTNKEQGKNLIHKLLLENRLKIEKI